MLSVYTRHHPDCAKKDDSNYRRCRCPKWLDGTLPGRTGRFRVSAKTKSWEQAELLARKYEQSALGGEDDVKAIKLTTVREAVGVFLGDAEARGLATATRQKLRSFFEVQLLGFAEERGITFLREFNPRNLTEWRQTWREKELARKKKFERVVGFFWFCVRQGWLRENPTATMGRVIAKHVPTDYFTADEYKCIIDATYRLGEYAERSWAPEKRGIRIRALTELMRWSGLRIRDAATLECSRLIENKLMLYQAKTGTPVFVPLPPHVADMLRSIPPGLKPNPIISSGPVTDCQKPSLPTGSAPIAGCSKSPISASRTGRQSVATAICSATPSPSRCCWPESQSTRCRFSSATPAFALPKSTTLRGYERGRISWRRASNQLGSCGL